MRLGYWTTRAGRDKGPMEAHHLPPVLVASMGRATRLDSAISLVGLIKNR